MNTVRNQNECTFRTRGSRFSGYLFPADTPEHFDQKLEEIRNLHPMATHHCYGWRIGVPDLEEFAQDDGEPSGTAGLPILNQLRSAELVNTGCVVVRYFGGTKLGKSGLIEAYGETAENCIQASSLRLLLPTKLYRIRYTYDEQNLIDKFKRRFDLFEREAEYLATVTLTLACPEKRTERFEAELQRFEHRLEEVKTLGHSFEVF